MSARNKAMAAKSGARDDLEDKGAEGPDLTDPLEQITEELTAITERLATLEAKSTANPNDPQPAEAGALADRITELEDEIKELKAAGAPVDPAEPVPNAELLELTKQIKRMAKRIDGFEAKSQAPLDPGIGEPVSYAKAVFDAAGKNGMLENWQNGQLGHLPSSGKGGIKVPGLLSPANEYKAATPIGLTQVGDLAPTYTDRDLIRLRGAPASMLAVVPYLGVDGATTYEYFRETGASQYGFLRTYNTADPGGGTTPTDTLEVDDVSGFIVGQDFRVHLVGGTEVETIVSIDTVNNYLVTAAGEIDFDVPIGTSVTSTVYSATAESSGKPAGWVAYTKLTGTLKTIAITAPMTMQALNSVSGFQSFVQEELQYRQQLVFDWHILYGDGTEPLQLDGFLTNTAAQTYLWSSGVAKDTRADAVMRARTQIQPKGALTVTMCENDWLKILLAKSSTDEHYLQTAFGPVLIINEPDRRAIGDITVNLTESIQEGDFLLANHARASKFVDQQRSSFATGYVNTQFIDNEITARHEDTVLHALRNFQSYVYGSWDSQP